MSCYSGRSQEKFFPGQLVRPKNMEKVFLMFKLNTYTTNFIPQFQNNPPSQEINQCMTKYT